MSSTEHLPDITVLEPMPPYLTSGVFKLQGFVLMPDLAWIGDAEKDYIISLALISIGAWVVLQDITELRLLIDF